MNAERESVCRAVYSLPDSRPVVVSLTTQPTNNRRFLMVGIPGHYKANKSVSWVELHGFRHNVRLAGADSGDGDEDEDDEDEVQGARRTKRE